MFLLFAAYNLQSTLFQSQHAFVLATATSCTLSTKALYLLGLADKNESGTELQFFSQKLCIVHSL